MTVPSNLVPTPISGLPVATTVVGTDTIIGVVGGVTSQMQVQDIQIAFSAVDSVAGTANEVTVTPTTGDTIVSLPSAMTFTGKTITGGTFSAPTLTTPILGIPTSGTLTNCTGYPSSALSGVVSATLGGTGVANNAASTLTISGSFATTLTVTGATGVTLPTTGTLATLAGTEELDNKTLDASVGKGTWTASGTWTLPALTLGGTVSGGGSQLNNIIIGTVTPLAGAFTTLSSQSLATSAATPLLLTNGQLVNVALTSQTVGATTLTIPNFASVADTFVFATLAQELDNKTLDSSIGKGTWTTSGTWTLPALTLGGTVSGGGSQLNNIIIGTVTPLAGTFTTLGAQSLATSAATPLLLTNGQLVNVALTSQTVGATTLTIPDFASVADTFVFTTLAQELDNKTLDSSVGKGTWTASGTWTLPALTLGGTVSGGGNNLNNIVIGAVTPLAGAFTTISSTGAYTNTVADGTTPMAITSATTVANLKSESAAAVGLSSKSAAYEFVLADAGKGVLHPTTDNNARTFTIPANSGGGSPVAYPVGTTLTIVNMMNTVTIAITTDTMTLANTATTGSRTLAVRGIATAIKLTSTTWLISGVGLT